MSFLPTLYTLYDITLDLMVAAEVRAVFLHTSSS
jgi:hypothetical protein